MSYPQILTDMKTLLKNNQTFKTPQEVEEAIRKACVLLRSNSTQDITVEMIILNVEEQFKLKKGSLVAKLAKYEHDIKRILKEEDDKINVRITLDDEVTLDDEDASVQDGIEDDH